MSEIHNEGGEMTFDQAKAAIEEAGQAETAQEAADAAAMTAPAEAAPDQAAEPTPEGEVTDPGATEFTGDTEDSFMGGDFNPDLLPDELQPGFKQLQAEWTRKTQALAEQRKEFEGYGDPDQVRAATELYNSLQDPEFLKNFYGELEGVVKELGLVEPPSQEEPAAPEAPAPKLSPELESLVSSDPELSPLAEQISAMQQELSSFREAQAAEREALDAERELMGQAAEIDRQVQTVREAHPDYAEADWDSIYERAIALDGNVLQAAERYEQDQERTIQSYLARKQAVPAAVNPSPGVGTVTEDGGDEEPGTLDDAQRRAEAYLQANDLSDFTG